MTLPYIQDGFITVVKQFTAYKAFHIHCLIFKLPSVILFFYSYVFFTSFFNMKFIVKLIEVQNKLPSVILEGE